MAFRVLMTAVVPARFGGSVGQASSLPAFQQAGSLPHTVDRLDTGCFTEIAMRLTTYYQNLAFDKDTGKLRAVGTSVENDKTGSAEVSGGLEPGEEHDMLRAFAAYNKLRYRIITLSKKDYLKSAKDYARESIPHAVLIDRLGVVRMVISGVSETGTEALAVGIRKLIDER
jgi:hypothetical protein